MESGEKFGTHPQLYPDYTIALPNTTPTDFTRVLEALPHTLHYTLLHMQIEFLRHQHFSTIEFTRLHHSFIYNTVLDTLRLLETLP